ncbi:hypothetical protein ABFX02_14G013400 [Erythranthe guttata]
MLLRRLCTSVSKSYPYPYPFLPSSIPANPLSNSNSYPILSPNFKTLGLGFHTTASADSGTAHSTNSTMDESRRPVPLPIPHPDTAGRAEVFRALEASLGSTFSSHPIAPNPNPLIIVISGPSGVGKDAVIKRLREVRRDLQFVVTATSRRKRPGEIDGEDYHFITKAEFLEMIERNELLEHALVYGEYKGIPKQQIREYVAEGRDVVLRVDVQGASTLRRILKNGAVFVFVVAESEAALVNRLIGRKTEKVEDLAMRVAAAREEIRCLKEFDYVVVNEDGELERSVEMVASIIDAEKAKVHQRRPLF